MKPIAEYFDECRRLTLDQFCEQHPHPFLLTSASSLVSFLKPYDAQQTPTVDRLVIGGVGLGSDDSKEPKETYKVIEALPRNGSVRRVSLGFSDDCDIHLDDPSVSRCHAYLAWTEHGTYLEDANSTAGTAVNGELLEPGKAIQISPGDRVALGTVDLVYTRAKELYPLVMLMFGL
jgi:hypothetical protein